MVCATFIGGDAARLLLLPHSSLAPATYQRDYERMQFSSDQLRTLLLHAVRSAMAAGETGLGLRGESLISQGLASTPNVPTC